MYFKVEQVLEKQQATTEKFYKGRGILICETDTGLFALKEFHGQEKKAAYLYQLGTFLTERRISCDYMLKNKEDALITEGVDGTKYTFHRWVKGRECDAKSRMDMVMAVSFLAGFHAACEGEMFYGGQYDEEELVSREPNVEMEREALKSREPNVEIGGEVRVGREQEMIKEAAMQTCQEPCGGNGLPVSQGTEISGQDAERLLRLEKPSETAFEKYRRRDRELRKIKKYITSRKNKSDFELLYLRCFPEYIRQSEEVLRFLEEHEGIFANHTMGVCHGDFNQHNVVVESGGMTLIHMEHAGYDAQVSDLSNFLRKCLEKHEWSETLGLEMLREYSRVHALNGADWVELYGRMSYPEKFWKIANRYYYSNKVLDSGKDCEKLKKELRQNEARKNFLAVLKRARL